MRINAYFSYLVIHEVMALLSFVKVLKSLYELRSIIYYLTNVFHLYTWYLKNIQSLSKLTSEYF